MSEKQNIQEELKGKSSILFKLKNSVDESMDLPDGYFENLEDKLIDDLFSNKLEEENKSRVKKLYWYSAIAIAASFALYFLTNQGVAVNYPQMEYSQTEAYLMDEIGSFEMTEFAEYETYTEEIDAESILLEEDLEDLLNI